MKDPDPMVTLSAEAADELRERLWAYEDFSGPVEHPAFDVTGAFASLGFLRQALRRRRRLWLTLGALGLVIGCGVYVTYPPAYPASTTLLITNASGSDPGTAMLTNQSLAESLPVAEAVVRQMKLPQSPASLLAAYTATSTSENVLEITVSAPSSARAVEEAQAIASAFLKFRAGLLRTQEQQQESALNQRVTQAENNLNSIAKQITELGGTVPSDNSSTSTGSVPPATGKLGRLTVGYRAADQAVSTLKQQVPGTITQDQIDLTSQIDGSQVLNPASAGKHSKLKYIAYDVVTGLFAGLVLGMAVVVIQALVSDRLRRRDDIAFALGAPVRLSVGPVLSRRLPATPGARAASERAVRQISQHLRHAIPREETGARGLALIPVENAPAVAPAVAAVAVSCAGDGMCVIVADLAPGAPVAALFGVAQSGLRYVHAGGPASVEVAILVPDPDDPVPTGPLSARSRLGDEFGDVFRRADLLLTVAELDPASGADHLATWATDAVAIITAGRTRGAHAHAVGEMLRLSGIHVASSVVVGADQTDESLGLEIVPPESMAGRP